MQVTWANAAGAAGGNVASTAFGAVFSATVGNWISGSLTAESLGTQMNSWWRNPCVPPGPESIFAAYQRGLMTEAEARRVLRNQGVWWSPAGGFQSERTNNHGKAWWAVAKLSEVRPSPAAIIDMWTKGYFRGDTDLFKRVMKQAGADSQRWEWMLPYTFQVPSVGDAMVARNRGLFTPAQFHEVLRRNGFGDLAYRNLFDKLRFQVPGPSDLVHFAVKEAFSPDVANAMRLYDEYPAAITPFMQSQGLDYAAGFQVTADGVQREARIPDLYWASHWQPISPGQAYEMLHKFRPNRIARYNQQGFNIQPFTIANVRQWLRINDYPPSVRDQLAALSYNPLRLQDIRKGIDYGINARVDANWPLRFGAEFNGRLALLTRQWAEEQYLDRGVHPDDAKVQVDLAVVDSLNKRRAALTSMERAAVTKTVAHVVSSYKQGLLTRGDAFNNLRRIGISPQASETYLDLVENEQWAEDAAGAVRAIKRAFMGGTLPSNQLGAALARGGVTPQYATRVIEQWNLERDFGHRAATVAQVQKWFTLGYITRTDATQRLLNLGWVDADVAILLADATRNAAILLAKAQRAAIMDQRRAASDLEKVQRELRRQFKENIATLRSFTPRWKLQVWLKKGIIGRKLFVARMVEMGYPEIVANGYADEVFACGPKGKCLPPESEPASLDHAANVPEHHVAVAPAKEGPVDVSVPKVNTDVPKVKTGL